MSDTFAPTKRALLIGINKYPYLHGRSLSGCVNDAEVMRQLLIDRFEFDPANVDVLLDGEATREGVLGALDRLYERTGTDDVVVLFYAGHGSQMTDVEGDEPDGLDETIVPTDSGRDPHPNRDIKDDEINAWLLRLGRKTSHAVLIVDSCHSATISRDPFGENVRWVPPDLRPPSALPPSTIDASVARGFEREAVGASGWLPVSSRYVLLAACGTDESAYEYRVDGAGGTVRHGALTYFLARELKAAPNGSTYRDVFEPVKRHVTTVYPRQTPQMEGTRDRELFGVRDLQPMVFIGVARRAGGSVTLAGGAAMDVTIGSEWGIYPPNAKRPDDQLRLGRVRVTASRAVACEAQIIEESVPGAIGEGARAVEERRSQGSRPFTVLIDPALDAASASELTALIQTRPLLATATGGAPADARAYLVQPRSEIHEGDPVPQVGPLQAPTWAVVGADGMLAVRPRTAEPGAAKAIVEKLEMLARYRNALQIENPDLASDLRGQVQLILRRQLPNGSWVDATADHTSGEVSFEEDDRLAFTITNGTDRTLYVAALDFGLTDVIAQLYPPAGASEPFGPRRSVTYGERDGEEMKLGFPQDYPFSSLSDERPDVHGFEHVKLFVTSQPADFGPLLQGTLRGADRGGASQPQSPLGELLASALEGGTRDASPVRRPPNEQWTTVARSFTLRRRPADTAPPMAQIGVSVATSQRQ
ncbi:MAG TPA: caspase family protein [Polyangiaceae bacterium]|nr:caspase family protein [Polyangiaceae bacterium]